MYDKLEKLHLSGAKVVLSKLPIGDVATQYFADRDMFCAGRVPDEDLKRTMKACGGSILTTVADLGDSVLGTCQHFEESQIGGDRYVMKLSFESRPILISNSRISIRFNLFKGCPQAKTCTIIIRGGAEQFMEETERSLHDAIMIVRRAKKNDAVVAGKQKKKMKVVEL